MRRTPLIPVAAAALALLSTSFAPAAHAAEPEVVVDGLVSVLSTAVAADGTVYASQNFMSTITKVAPGGETTDIYADEGQREVGALSVAGDVLTFATTQQEGQPADARIYTLTPDGEGLAQDEIANTWAFEKAKNPDGKTKYGVFGLSKSCKKQMPKPMRKFVLPHGGIKESHPYATATSGDTTYVADAAANAIFAIDESGISTLAVLPPVKVKVNKTLRKGLGLPKCADGKTYKGEAVPTDVEVGPDGNLYVTTLGGAAGEAMPVGALYRVTTAGAVTEMAPGLMSPVGVAFDGTTALISMLFPGIVLAAPLGGEPTTFAELPFPGDVEVAGDSVYVTRTGLTDPPEGPATGAVLKYPTPMG
ncbi:ScyD/ScyE family protein [Nocardioides sp. SR21]|uniref:ScyD/ScyE family protein n=1 Tax=Nocardioides sp. SR21 TaxID=2919501 RepID=UPI001FAA5992|nr:ScyD/ScyE family protein [Nocardioides sp. SR21]